MNSSPRPIRRFSRWQTRKHTFVLEGTTFTTGNINNKAKAAASNHGSSTGGQVENAENYTQLQSFPTVTDKVLNDSVKKTALGGVSQNAILNSGTQEVQTNILKETREKSLNRHRLDNELENESRATAVNAVDDNETRIVGSDDVEESLKEIRKDSSYSQPPSYEKENAKSMIESATVAPNPVKKDMKSGLSSSFYTKTVKGNNRSRRVLSTRKEKTKAVTEKSSSVSLDLSDSKDDNDNFCYSFGENLNPKSKSNIETTFVEEEKTSAVSIEEDKESSTSLSVSLKRKEQPAHDNESPSCERSLRNRNSLSKSFLVQYPMEFLSSNQKKSLSSKAKQILMDTSISKSSTSMASSDTIMPTSLSVLSKRQEQPAHDAESSSCERSLKNKNDLSKSTAIQYDMSSDHVKSLSSTAKKVRGNANDSKATTSMISSDKEVSNILNSDDEGQEQTIGKSFIKENPSNKLSKELSSSYKGKLLPQSKGHSEKEKANAESIREDHESSTDLSNSSKTKECPVHETESSSCERSLRNRSNLSKSISVQYPMEYLSSNHMKSLSSQAKQMLMNTSISKLAASMASSDKIMPTSLSVSSKRKEQPAHDAESSSCERSMKNNKKSTAKQNAIEFSSSNHVKSLSSKAKEMLVNTNISKSPTSLISSDKEVPNILNSDDEGQEQTIGKSFIKENPNNKLSKKLSSSFKGKKLPQSKGHSEKEKANAESIREDHESSTDLSNSSKTKECPVHETESSSCERSLRNRSNLSKSISVQYPMEYLSSNQKKSLSSQAKQILMNTSINKSAASMASSDKIMPTSLSVSSKRKEQPAHDAELSSCERSMKNNKKSTAKQNAIEFSSSNHVKSLSSKAKEMLVNTNISKSPTSVISSDKEVPNILNSDDEGQEQTIGKSFIKENPNNKLSKKLSSSFKGKKLPQSKGHSEKEKTNAESIREDHESSTGLSNSAKTKECLIHETESSSCERSLRNRNNLSKSTAVQYPMEFLSSSQVKSLSSKAKQMLMNTSVSKSSALMPSSDTIMPTTLNSEVNRQNQTIEKCSYKETVDDKNKHSKKSISPLKCKKLLLSKGQPKQSLQQQQCVKDSMKRERILALRRKYSLPRKKPKKQFEEPVFESTEIAANSIDSNSQSFVLVDNSKMNIGKDRSSRKDDLDVCPVDKIVKTSNDIRQQSQELNDTVCGVLKAVCKRKLFSKSETGHKTSRPGRAVNSQTSQSDTEGVSHHAIADSVNTNNIEPTSDNTRKSPIGRHKRATEKPTNVKSKKNRGITDSVAFDSNKADTSKEQIFESRLKPRFSPTHPEKNEDLINEWMSAYRHLIDQLDSRDS